MTIVRRLLLGLAALVASIAGADPVRADVDVGPFRILTSASDRVVGGVGVFNLFQDDDPDDVNNDGRSVTGAIEYRGGWRFLGFGPLIGVLGNADGGIYGFAGAVIDIEIADSWVLSPSAAAGLYREGDSKDLGGPIEFRTSIEVAREVAGGLRLGVRISHFSNAFIHDDNPGTETLMATISVPLDWQLTR